MTDEERPERFDHEACWQTVPSEFHYIRPWIDQKKYGVDLATHRPGRPRLADVISAQELTEVSRAYAALKAHDNWREMLAWAQAAKPYTPELEIGFNIRHFFLFFEELADRRIEPFVLREVHWISGESPPDNWDVLPHPLRYIGDIISEYRRIGAFTLMYSLAQTASGAELRKLSNIRRRLWRDEPQFDAWLETNQEQLPSHAGWINQIYNLLEAAEDRLDGIDGDSIPRRYR